MNIFLTLCLLCFLSTLRAEDNSELPHKLPMVNNTYLGNLNYIDYSNGKEVVIPIEVNLKTSRDQKHFMVDRVYTDPGYQVFSLSIMRYLSQKAQWIDDSYEGGNYSSKTYEIVSFTVDAADQWQVIRTIESSDNGRQALLTLTEQLKGNEFTAETRVDYLDTPENENLRRNWIIASSTAE